MSVQRVKPDEGLEAPAKDSKKSAEVYAISSNGHNSTAAAQNGNGSVPFPIKNGDGANNGEDYLSLEKGASSKSRLCKILVMGLLLYVVNISLHIAIASHYLDMRSCHRGLSQTMHNFQLSEILNLNNSLEQLGSGGNATASGDQEKTSLLESVVNDQLYFRVRTRLINLVPEHWVARILEIASFQLSNYRPSQIAEMCTFNDIHFNSTFEIGTYVCKGALTADQRSTILTTFADVDKEVEDQILESAMNQEIEKLLILVPKAIGLELPPQTMEVVEKFASELTPEDASNFMELLDDPEVAPKVPAMLKAMGKIDPGDLKILGESFATIKKENLPRIDAAFNKLGISMASFLTDPGSLIRFFRDPEMSKILLTIQSLLPTFEPKTINAVLQVKNAFDDTDGAGDVLNKVLGLPLGTLMRAMSVEITPEDRDTLQKLGPILEDPKAKRLFELVKELGLLDESSRPAVIAELSSKCAHDRLKVSCQDSSVDLCPNGHLMYALLTFLPFFQPGIMLAVSEFKFYKAFRFGALFGKMFGQNLNRVFKYMLLPLYILLMIPLKVVITITQ